MNTKSTFITSLRMLMLLGMADVSLATAQDTRQPAAAAEKLNAPLAQDPQLLTGKLENGLSYIIRPTKEPAGRGSVRLYVGVGSLHETDETSGISHFLEHMVFNGSRTFKRGELIPTMQKLGLGFGGDANAYTSLLHTVYMLDLPNLEEKTVDFALTIMRDFADGATLEADAIDHERGIVVSELKSRDSASYRAMISVLGELTEGTRVAHYMPIGREEVIRNAPYDLVRDYYKNHYAPERMTLILTGDFKPEEAEEWVKKHFNTMQARSATPAPPMGELKTTPSEKLIDNPEQATTNIITAVLSPYTHQEDTLEQRLEEYPLVIATGMLNRRLRRLTQQQDCPFIAAQVNKDEMFQTAESFGLSLTATPENWQKALELIVQQLRQAVQYGFSEQEMTETTEALLSNLKQACDSAETVTADAMASRLVNAVSEKTTITPPSEDLRVAQIAVQRLKENPDIARKALAEAFAGAENARLIVSGKLPEGITKETLRAAYNTALQAEVPKPAEEKALTFAYETIGIPGAIATREMPAGLGVTCLTLTNGVKVNLKPIHYRKSSISVTAAVDGGRLALPNTPGLATMTSAVMQRGGLQEHSMNELERLLASKQVQLNFNMSSTRLLYSGRTNAQDLELQCKLLAAAILHPGFRNEGEIMLRRRLEEQYKKLSTTPDGAFAMQMPRVLFGDDTRFVIPTQQEVEACSAEDVRAAIEPMLSKGALEVSIVGDFEVEDVLPIIERTFGAMPKREADFRPVTEAQRHVEFRPWGRHEYLRYPTELDKTLVVHARPAGNGRDHRRNRRLTILASIVREKLFDGLRAAMGESYSPRVQVRTNSEQDDAAYILTVSAGVKGNRAKVSAAMESICNGIGQGQISQEDFDCAFRPYYAQMQKALTSAEYWEDSLVQLQSDPQRIELMQGVVEDVRSITPDEIRELAKEVFGKDNADFFFVVPENYDENAAPEQTAPSALPQADLSSLNAPAPGEYMVITTAGTNSDPEWAAVANTLLRKYEKATLAVVPDCAEETLLHALREHAPRYVAFVLRPEEISREVVNAIHRATRAIDDDPYGDCIWGIVSGSAAGHAMRIAAASKPLVIRRVLSTTNVDASRFEHSYCITDWEGFPILEQTGYTEPTKTTYTTDTPEGQDILENGVHGKFAQQMETQRPQFIVTSSHATPFNLEMPFSMGLIFSSNNRFYLMGRKQLPAFVSALDPAMAGNPDALKSLATAMHSPTIEPDGTPRVWLASGNCLIGDARQTTQSMVITAISDYTCNQFVGYTVPSWYGEAGWGTLSLFMGNTDNTTLAESFFLNNQFLLHKTMQLDPRLMKVHFNEPRLGPCIQRDLMAAGIDLRSANAKHAVGLVHDRDTLAFYGDPGWAALVDHSHAHAPLRISWDGDTAFTITANSNYTGRAGVWFPKAAIGRNAAGCDLPGAIFTNDFILIPELTLKAGESITVRILPTEAGKEEPRQAA